MELTAQRAREIARRFIEEQVALTPHFAGAFFHGSINDLPDSAPLAPTSDVDLIVCSANSTDAKPGKRRHEGLLLDVTYRPLADFLDPEVVLAQHQIAPSFKSPSVIADPTGGLTMTNERVMRDFAKREWVERRVESAIGKIRTARIDPNALFPAQVLSWLFPTGITTHVLLVAGLMNPTVRRRYLEARTLLTEYRKLSLYEGLIGLLGCGDMTPERAQGHLGNLAQVFDAAAGAPRSSYPFAGDLTPEAKPVAIQGSQDLIDQGDHREAIFWMVATFARCQQVLEADAPELAGRHDSPFRSLLADLGIQTLEDMQQSQKALQSKLESIRRLALAIMDANPSITG